MLTRKSLSLLLIFLLAGAVAWGDEFLYPEGGAKFLAGNGTAMIFETTESIVNEEAVVPLSYYIDADPFPTENLTDIVITLTFDESKVDFLDVSLDNFGQIEPGDIYWNGTISYDDTEPGQVVIILDLGSVEAETDYTEFAYAKFTPLCQDGSVGNTITVDEGQNDSYVFDALDQRYYAGDGDGTDGAVYVADYEATFNIGEYGENLVLQGVVGLDQEIIVPVYAKTNFNCSGVSFTIDYDNNKFQFLGLTDYETYFPNIQSHPLPGEDPLFIASNILFVAEMNMPFYDSVVIFNLHFRVINNWEGQSTSIYFTQDPKSIWIGVRNYDISSFNCWPLSDRMSPLFTYNSEIVTIENYAATLKTVVGDMIWPADITAGQAEFPVTVQMKNNFIAGGGTVGQTQDIYSRIRVDFSFTAAQNAQIADLYQPLTPDPENPLDDFWFEINQSSAKGIAWDVEFYSVPTTGPDNKREVCNEFTDLLQFDLEYDVLPPTSFEARTMPIAFDCNFDILPARVVDQPTGLISTQCGASLTFATGSNVEYAVGEFYAPGVTGIGLSTPVYQNYYVRHNQDTAGFRVKIRESGPHGMNSITPYPGVDIVEQGSDYVILQSNAEWTSNPVLTRTQIARIKYVCNYTPRVLKADDKSSDSGEKDSHPPVEYCYKTTNIYFENALIEDNYDLSPTYFLIAGVVRSRYNCDIIITDPVPDIEPWKGDNTPTEFALYANRPNPFNPTTSIAFDMPVSGHVNIEVFNILGQKVATLVDEVREAGHHEVIWDANGFGSGVFLYRMTTDGYQKTQKMLLMK